MSSLVVLLIAERVSSVLLFPANRLLDLAKLQGGSGDHGGGNKTARVTDAGGKASATSNVFIFVLEGLLSPVVLWRVKASADPCRNEPKRQEAAGQARDMGRARQNELAWIFAHDPAFIVIRIGTVPIVLQML